MSFLGFASPSWPYYSFRGTSQSFVSLVAVSPRTAGRRGWGVEASLNTNEMDAPLGPPQVCRQLETRPPQHPGQSMAAVDALANSRKKQSSRTEEEALGVLQSPCGPAAIDAGKRTLSRGTGKLLMGTARVLVPVLKDDHVPAMEAVRHHTRPARELAQVGTVPKSKRQEPSTVPVPVGLTALALSKPVHQTTGEHQLPAFKKKKKHTVPYIVAAIQHSFHNHPLLRPLF